MSRLLSSRFATLALALLLALAAAGAVAMYVSRYKSSVAQDHSTVGVVVAKKDIPEGLPGDDAIKNGFLEVVQVQQGSLAPSALQSADGVRGRVAATTVFAGSQILNEQFPQKPNNLVSLEVTGNKRAVQVPLDQSRGLVGTLKTKDRVDVLGSFAVQRLDREGKNKGAPVHVTVTLLRNVPVLRAPEPEAKRAGAAGGVAATSGSLYAMLELTDAQAQKVVYALENGKIWLTLRGAHATDSPGAKDPSLSVTTIASTILGLEGYKLLPTPAGGPDGSPEPPAPTTGTPATTTPVSANDQDPS